MLMLHLIVYLFLYQLQLQAIKHNKFLTKLLGKLYIIILIMDN